MKKALSTMEERFYYCESCGNLAILALASGVTPYCCNTEMKKLTANSIDASKEKHVPAMEWVSEHEIHVKVGSTPHPMTKEHNIRFVCLETDRGGIIRYFNEDDIPEANLKFEGNPIAVYAFCNIHGLWKFDIPAECPSKNKCCTCQ